MKDKGSSKLFLFHQKRDKLSETIITNSFYILYLFLELYFSKEDTGNVCGVYQESTYLPRVVSVNIIHSCYLVTVF